MELLKNMSKENFLEKYYFKNSKKFHKKKNLKKNLTM